MAVGDTFVDNQGVEYEIVWSGGEGLVPARDTKSSPDSVWEPPPRIYNKTGKHAKNKDFWRKDVVLRPSKGDEGVEHLSSSPEQD